jgi:hypothetical protein
VDCLSRSEQLQYLLMGLLTPAWLRFLEGEEPGAPGGPGRGGGVAARGPMPLFLADIHLYRGQLFRDRAALAEARRLIEKHGYGRRLGELADAEAAMGTQPA